MNMDNKETMREIYDEDTLNEFQEAFKMFDIDNSGDIDVGELGAVFAQLG